MEVKTQDHPVYTTDRGNDASVLARAVEILNTRTMTSNECVDGPSSAEMLVRIKLGNRRDEHFMVLFLNVRHYLLAAEELFHGTIDGASVYPRVLCRRALELNASAIIIAHNHPSGLAEPSRADRSLTKRIQEAVSYFDVRLLDHFVVGDGECVSFAQKGWL